MIVELLFISDSDKPKISKIVESLNIKVTTAKFPDPKTHLQAILHQWLPLSASILDLVCSYLPSPLEMDEERVKKLMCSGFRKFEAYPEKTRKLKDGIVFLCYCHIGFSTFTMILFWLKSYHQSFHEAYYIHFSDFL